MGLQAEVLTETTERRLMLLYNPEQLSATLQQPRVEQVLTSIGYEEGITKKIALLQQRTNGEEFPHEIGFFLGYPIKDVLGFMGRVDLPLSKMGPWKIYGDPEPSLRLISRHSRARKSIRQRLNRTTEPYKLLFHEALVA